MHHLRWASAGLVLAVACGGSTAAKPPPQRAAQAHNTPVEATEPSSPVHKRGSGKLIVEVGRAGGTLELDNGARLEIPQGALSEPVEITFSRGNHTTAFSNHEWERPLGPTLEIAPAIGLGSPVKVSVPLASLPEGFSEDDLALGLEVVSDTQRAVEMTGTQTRWDYLPASTAGGRATAQLDSVPGYRLQFVVSKSE
jgi:hypothetical protein